MKTYRYDQVAERILHLIQNGVLGEGDKIPSLRQLSQELNVSVNTVKEAYWKLEGQNHIYAVPQSGYFVKKQWQPPAVSEEFDPSHLDPKQVSICHIYGAFQNMGRCTPEIGLGISALNPEFWPTDRMSQSFQKALRERELETYNYLMLPGDLTLRRQIARLGMASGQDLSPEEIVITNGCHEAIFLALMVLCKPGDTVVLESPVYFSLLQLLEQLNLRVIEVPSSVNGGMNLDTLRFILENHPVKAMFAITNYNNPLGYCLRSRKKRELVRLLADYRVPLIEDDIYGDMNFGSRPDTCKAYDKEGEVLLCSSFSKTLAPGLRVGWIAPGKYYDQVLNMKTLLNIATPSINQISVAYFLKEGGYDRHMRHLRNKLKTQVANMRAHLLRRLPKGSRVTRPQGGTLLWVELPKSIDTFEIYRQALKESILIAPGQLFSIRYKYTHCFRINAGTWNERVQTVIDRLSVLCHQGFERQLEPKDQSTLGIFSDENSQRLRNIVHHHREVQSAE